MIINKRTPQRSISLTIKSKTVSEIKLCNGSFIASLQKGKDGKQNWTYTPVLSRLGKKIVPEGSLKETPQLDVQYDLSLIHI